MIANNMGGGDDLRGLALNNPNFAVPSPGSTDSESNAGHVNLAGLLSAVRRRWFLALPIGCLLGLVGALAGWLVTVPKYTAAAYLRVDSSHQVLLFSTADQKNSQANDFKLYKNTQQQMVKIPFVLNAAVRKGDLSKLPEFAGVADPITWLRDNLKVMFPADGEVMQVSIEMPNPASAIKVVNSVVDSYMAEVVMNERNERVQRQTSLERLYDEKENEVRARRTELKNLASSLGTSDSDSLTVAQQNALEQFGMMQEKLSEVQFQLMQAEGEYQVAKNMVERMNSTSDSAGKQSETLSLARSDAERRQSLFPLEDEISRLRAKLATLSSKVGSNHPSAVALASELGEREAMLRDRLELPLAPQMAVGPGRLSGNSVFDLVTMSARIEVLKNQEKILKEKVDKLADETRQLGKSSIDVELMRSEIAGLEDVLKTVRDEKERTSIELKSSSRVSMLSPADNAIPPDPLKRLIRAGGLGIVGFCMPWALLIIWDLSYRRIDNLDVAKQTLLLENLGSIPQVTGNAIFLSEMKNRRQRQQLQEAVDSTVAMLVHKAEHEFFKVIMITSAISNEGKSTLVCQLAQGLVRYGKRVAVVDFDLRNPTIHTYLNQRRAPGLSEVLSGTVSVAVAIQSSMHEHLYTLAAGDQVVSLQRHVANGRISALMDELRAAYDFVLVDVAPVLPVADTRMISKFADGVLITLMRDVSRLPLVSSACQVLKSYGATILGCVAIGNRSHSYAYGDYRYGLLNHAMEEAGKDLPLNIEN